MPSRYMPRPDADFGAWANHFDPAVKEWWDAHGLDTTDLKPLNDALAAWNAAFAAHVSAQNAARAARQDKDAARATLEATARPVVNFVQSFPTTTDAERASLGIALRRVGGPASPTPATRPLVHLARAARFTHTLRFSDEATPTRSARPKGVLGAEVWVALTGPNQPPPADEAALRFLALAVTAPQEAVYPAEAVGQTAHYVLRWVSTTGERGPWSEVCSATIAA